MKRGKLNKKISSGLSEKGYENAIKEFAKHTIHNPDFFKLSKEEQHQQAREFIKKHRDKKED